MKKEFLFIYKKKNNKVTKKPYDPCWKVNFRQQGLVKGLKNLLGTPIAAWYLTFEVAL